MHDFASNSPLYCRYCLMSVSGCYTDFHLDFGGTSVWYHLHHGEKIFIVIPPSEEHYDLFLAWQLSGQQETMFFPDLVHRCQAVHLRAGDTFIMPSGEVGVSTGTTTGQTFRTSPTHQDSRLKPSQDALSIALKILGACMSPTLIFWE